ncbi:MAG: HMA2 domain-containing protein [Chloroflexota bacterium]
MSLEIVAGLIGSQLVRAVASEVATTLACQAISHAVGTMARPTAAATDLTAVSEAPARATSPAASATELRALPTVEILSAIPGRTRLRVHGLRDDAARAAEVTATVRALDGVTAVEANTMTGSLLVRFDARQTDVQTIVAALEPPVTVRRLRAAERAPYLRLVVG